MRAPRNCFWGPRYVLEYEHELIHRDRAGWAPDNIRGRPNRANRSTPTAPSSPSSRCGSRLIATYDRHPTCTRFTKKIGASFSETTMRPNPTTRRQAFPTWRAGCQQDIIVYLTVQPYNYDLSCVDTILYNVPHSTHTGLPDVARGTRRGGGRGRGGHTQRCATTIRCAW